MFDLLEEEYLKIGRPTPWNDGSGRVSLCIQFKDWFTKHVQFDRQMRYWLAANTRKWTLMYDFDQGDPFWTAIIQEEDLTIFLLRFSKSIC